jgi:hypothetical protein
MPTWVHASVQRTRSHGARALHPSLHPLSGARTQILVALDTPTGGPAPARAEHPRLPRARAPAPPIPPAPEPRTSHVPDDCSARRCMRRCSEHAATVHARFTHRCTHSPVRAFTGAPAPAQAEHPRRPRAGTPDLTAPRHLARAGRLLCASHVPDGCSARHTCRTAALRVGACVGAANTQPRWTFAAPMPAPTRGVGEPDAERWVCRGARRRALGVSESPTPSVSGR